MATLNANKQLTLASLAKRRDPSGNLATIAEVLDEDNEILQDCPWAEANGATYHKIVRRSYLPTGTWRKINETVAVEASQVVEVLEAIGMLESFSEADKALVDMSPNPAQFRSDEAVAFIEGMGQSLVSKMIYGNQKTTPEEISGLTSRMGSLATTTNVLNAGGSGSDLTSIYVVQWGLRQAHMVYPKGHPFMGIEHEDLGVETKTDSSGNLIRVYRDHFTCKGGMAVHDNECIGRIANIESTGASNIFDEDDLITLLNRMKNGGRNAMIYVNDTIKTQMEIALKDKNNVNYTADAGEGLAGERVLRFRGNPVRLVDQITITESAIS